MRQPTLSGTGVLIAALVFLAPGRVRAAELERPEVLIPNSYHQPQSFYQQHRELALTILVVGSGLLLATVVLALNILRRRRAEAALRAANETLHAILEATPLPVYALDLEGRVQVVWNRAAEHVLGWKKEEVLGGPPPCVPPEKQAQLAGFMERLRAGEALEGVVVERKRRDGSAVEFAAYAAPMHGADGRITGATVVLLDLSERRAAEAAARAQHEYLATLFRVLPVGISLTDVAGNFVQVNDTWCALTGYTREEVIGRHFTAVVPVELRPQAEALHAQLLSGNLDAPTERVRVRKDGTAFPVLAYNALTVDEKGQRQVITSVSDLSARKKAEAALRESEARFRSTLEHSPSAYVLYDRDLRIRFANPQAAKMRGRAEAELLGHTDEEFWPPAVTGVYLPLLRLAQENGQAQTQEVTLLLSSGPGTFMFSSVPLLGDDGRVQQILTVATDITGHRKAQEERRRLEAQLQQTQKLESLGVLAGGIAHDFNNLLTGILGYASLALEELSPLSPARDSIQHVVSSSRRAADLTRQMLAYSGKGRFIIQPVQLSQVVEEMAHLLEISISKKCVLKYHFAENLPPVEADVTQLRQVILNLILNASEAIGDRSGVIAISTGAMTCDRAYLSESYLDDNLAPGLFVYLEVADTGCGMTPEVQARIFDPFFTTKFAGRGLGLAAVLGIVRGHRGALKVYSEPKRGTTFKVLFPAGTHPEGPHPAEAPSAQSWRGSGSILVADDEETVRALARRVLESAGFTVLVARDGEEALAEFRAHREQIRAVLLDLTMPHLDGEETFRELRRLQPEVKVILSSGYNEQDAINRFAGKGLTGFIQKPYTNRDLLDALRGALEPQPDEKPG